MLKGKRVILRPLVPKDLSETLALRHDFEANKSYLGYIFPINLKNEQEWLEKIYSQDIRERIDLAIATRRTNRFIGLIGVNFIDYIHRRAKFGIYIKREYWGQGFAKESMQLFFEYLFEQINLNRIYLEVTADNNKAIQLYKSLGFKKEGVLRFHCYQDGRYKDVEVYGMLKNEFLSTKKS